MTYNDPLRVQLAFAFTLGAMHGVLIRKGERSVRDLVEMMRTMPEAPAPAPPASSSLHSNRIFKLAIVMGAARGFLRGR